VTESKSNVNVQPETGALPCVAHVEVGGSLGGSVLRLGAYLKHCDPQAFRHEVLFYQRPAGCEAVFDDRWTVIDLGYAVPPQSSSDDEKARRWARTFLVNRPRLQAWVGLVRGGWKLLTSLPRALRLARCFRRRGYALIHCNNSYTYQIPTVLGAWLARKPLVSHFRTIRRLTPLERWLSRRSITIVAVAQEVVDDLTRQRVRAPVVVCYDPQELPTASAENVAALRRELLGEGKALVGTVTRLEDKKGIEDLLAAADLLRSRWPGVRYVIVGDGSKAEALKSLAAERDLLDRVRFVGFRSNVFDYYACMDLFVCPSLVEGGPCVVLEAMVMGKPVAATRVGRVPELIQHGENGLIANLSDPEGLAQAIESLLADPSRRQAMGTRAAVSAKIFCDPVAQARKLDDIFTRAFSAALPEIRGSHNEVEA